MKKGGMKFYVTLLLRWLLADDVKKVVEAMALSKCVWGPRYHESRRHDVSIQLGKIKSITPWTVVKKGGKKFNLTLILRWLLANDVNNVVEAMALSKCVWGLRHHKSH